MFIKFSRLSTAEKGMCLACGIPLAGMIIIALMAMVMHSGL
jgi:hypothetical protein